MSVRIRWTVSAELEGGPGFSSSRMLEVEAYDSLSVDVIAGAADMEVEVQPGGPGQVSFIALNSSVYSADLVYKVNSDANPEIALDQPHLLAGAGAIGLLAGAPSRLFFSNNGTDDIRVGILVGRDATP